MTCAKRRVVCVIRDFAGNVIGVGENKCRVPQKVCPRAPGEGYEKCVSVCEQPGHAELEAVADAMARGHDLNNARAYLFGHNHACEGCLELLRGAGVATLKVFSDDPPATLN